MPYSQAEIEPALDAFEHCISRFTVGLVFESTGPFLDTASATAVSWRGRRLLVTARHVFPQGAEDRGVTLLLPSDRPLSRGKESDTLPPLELNCVKQLTQISVVRCDFEDAVDLAYFEISESVSANSDLQFYDLPLIARTPEPGAGCILCGFPADLSASLSKGEWLARLVNRRSKICMPDDQQRFLKGFEPDFHFLMKFRKADKGNRAEGFSGGGVWFPLRQNSKSKIRRALPGLAGIQSKWFSSSAITASVKVEHLVRFLDQTMK